MVLCSVVVKVENGLKKAFARQYVFFSIINSYEAQYIKI